MIANYNYVLNLNELGKRYIYKLLFNIYLQMLWK